MATRILNSLIQRRPVPANVAGEISHTTESGPPRKSGDRPGGDGMSSLIHCVRQALHYVGQFGNQKSDVRQFSVRFGLQAPFYTWVNFQPVDPRCSEFLRMLVSSNWTKAQAARELPVAPSVVGRYVKGDVKPSLTVLRLMAGLTGNRVLLDGEGPTPMQWKEGPRYLDDWETQVVNVLRRVSPESRRRAIAAIRDLVEAFAQPVRYTKPPTKPPESQAPEQHALPHPEDEESVISALEEIIQAGREEDDARAAATQARRSSAEKQPPPERDPAHSTPRRSVPGHRPSKSGSG